LDIIWQVDKSNTLFLKMMGGTLKKLGPKRPQNILIKNLMQKLLRERSVKIRGLNSSSMVKTEKFSDLIVTGEIRTLQKTKVIKIYKIKLRAAHPALKDGVFVTLCAPEVINILSIVSAKIGINFEHRRSN